MNTIMPRIAAALAALLTAGITPALAQYPDRPVRAIVPFAAGSSNDTLARLMSGPLTKLLGHQMVIANMPGADGRIGIGAMAKSAPDGYTILFSGGAISLIPALRINVPYDPDKDVQPVAELGAGPYVVAASPKLPVRNLLDLAKLAHDSPNKLNAATAGNSSFMALVLFQILTDSKIEIISYKGTGPAALAIMASEVDFASMDASAFANFIPSGKIRGLAVAGPAFGVYTKGGTPMPIVRRLNADINKVLATPEVGKYLRSIGLEPGSGTVEEYTDQYQKDLARWKNVVAKAKLPLQE